MTGQAIGHCFVTKRYFPSDGNMPIWLKETACRKLSI